MAGKLCEIQWVDRFWLKYVDPRDGERTHEQPPQSVSKGIEYVDNQEGSKGDE